MNAPHETLLEQERTASSWLAQNQRWLTRELARLRARIDAQTGAEADDGAIAPDTPLDIDEDFIPALDRCAGLFGLSKFERELLLLAAGVELDTRLRQSVQRAQALAVPGSSLSQPTFALSFGLLAQAHWDAAAPQAPLRWWHLVETESRRSPTLQPLYIDERVLHFLTGVAAFDERLLGVARIEPPVGSIGDPALAQRIASELAGGDARPPLVLLTQHGADLEPLRTAARDAVAVMRSHALWILAHDLPNDAAALAEAALRIDREAALSGCMPVIELDASGENSAEIEHRAIALLADMRTPALLLGGPEPTRLARLARRRIARVHVPEAQAWILLHQASHAGAGEPADALAAALAPALQQFHLSRSVLRGVLEQLAAAPESAREADALARQAWHACREAARGGLDSLAQRVESRASFDDLVLPPAVAHLLREIAQHLPHRQTVYGDWHMGGKSTRGQGLCVLFAGESGTGKTLAAEAIANEAALDLYRIDLATVVSKYIGETEKNLKRVFDAAEASGAVLLFDEADALYGKRSEVKDSHDRYANIEVAYLLQRVEAYRGLAILTTNLRSALDRAFLRRIRYIVQFPFPDEAARLEIWRRELPPSVPTRDIDFAQLARMQMSGGHIRSAALSAAFIAAAAGQKVSMEHVRQAAQREAAKLERPLTEAAQRGWS